MAFAKALETLGVNWGKVLPIPKADMTKFPEVKKLMDEGIHLQQHHWRLDGSQMAKIFQGPSPANDSLQLEATAEPPAGGPIESAPERPEELSPGLTPELKELVEQIAGMTP